MKLTEEEIMPKTKRRPRPRTPRRGRCQRCGCMDGSACLTPMGPCYWITPERDLCSACVGPLLLEHGRELKQLWTVARRLLDQVAQLVGQVVAPLVGHVERLALRSASPAGQQRSRASAARKPARLHHSR